MPAHTPMPISLYSYSEAAAILKVHETWLRRHIKRLPHIKLGPRVRFTDSDLQRLVDLFHYEPGTGRPCATSGTSTHTAGTLRPLPRAATRPQE